MKCFLILTKQFNMTMKIFQNYLPDVNLILVNIVYFEIVTSVYNRQEKSQYESVKENRIKFIIMCNE